MAVLDIMLSGLDGFSIARKLKRTYDELPIILLSARAMLDDKLEGLSIADDYVTKPFQPAEIMARIEVLLRRFNKMDEVLTLHHISINTQDFEVRNQENSEEIMLTQTQTNLLRYFTLPSILAINSERFGPLYPWAQPFFMMYMQDDVSGLFFVPLSHFLLVTVGSFVIFLALGTWSFTRKAI